MKREIAATLRIANLVAESLSSGRLRSPTNPANRGTEEKSAIKRKSANGVKKFVDEIIRKYRVATESENAVTAKPNLRPLRTINVLFFLRDLLPDLEFQHLL